MAETACVLVPLVSFSVRTFNYSTALMIVTHSELQQNVYFDQLNKPYSSVTVPA